jgi:hypothetical protein
LDRWGFASNRLTVLLHARQQALKSLDLGAAHDELSAFSELSAL